MKLQRFVVLLSIAQLAVSLQSVAAESFTDAQRISFSSAPKILGSGCSNEVDEIKREGDRLVILPNRYEISGSSVGQSEIKNCAIAIPVQGRPGFRIAARRLEISFQLDQVENSKASFHAEIFNAGSRGPRMTERFTRYEGSKKFQFAPNRNQLDWGACGADVIVRSNTALHVEGAGFDGSVKVESLALDVATEKCTD